MNSLNYPTMHIYSNLKPDVKRHFWYRSIGDILLTLMAIYCIIALSLKLGASYIIGMLLGCTCFYWIVNILILWHLIYYNRLNAIAPIWFTDLMVGIIFTMQVSLYFGLVGTDKILFNYWEFIPMTLYAIPYYGAIMIFIGMGIWKLFKCCYDLMKETNDIVQERNKESVPKV